MKTESVGSARARGAAAHRSQGLSGQHLLTPRHGHRALRLPPALLENRLLATGPLSRLTRPSLRYSRSLDPPLPLGIGPYTLASPALPPEPQYQPENQCPVTGTPQASEDPAEVAPPLPAYDLSCPNYEDLEQGHVGRDTREGLRDVPDPSQNRDAALRRRKVELLNEVCCSLITGANFSETEDQTRKRLQTLCEEIAQQDPEFILKAALYTRQELNIRTTANFLLALSAWIPSSRPHVRRYFCQAVRLPSDWIEVACLYQSLASDSGRLSPFPSCLRQSLSDRFKGFDEYQLAKYNTRKQRCKSSRVRLGKSTPTLSDTDPKVRFSMKKLIRWLHLKDPTYHVMCLLGRRYPSDLQSFSRSRLPGPWDSRRSGKRMKLQLPESWERELSLHGNRAEVWERLIDHQKLPYMAMLRNLRNVIAAGVSRGHHAQLLRRLADRDAVIRSRQFPFRFLAAYKALEGLQRRLDEKDQPLPTKAALVQQALETSMRPPRKLRELLGRARKAGPGRRPAPRVAYAYRWATKRLAVLRKSRIVRYDQELLESYRRALVVAVEISATHNVPPLPGRSAILCCVDHNMRGPCVSARSLHLPRSRTPEEVAEAKAWKSPVILEVAILLALMAHHVSEHAELVLFNSNTYRCLQLDSRGLLANVDRLLQEAQSLQETEVCDFSRPTGLLSYLTLCVENHVKIDTILQLDCTSYHSNLRETLQFYRYHVNPELLFVLVSMSSFQCSVTEEADGKEIYLNGCSEQILRFVCERGSSRLLEHVEGIDNVFQLPQGRADRRKRRRMEVEPAAVSPLLPTPTLRWRSVRVFVSSTFRDMHAERDLLIRSVFPELRARASRHLLRIDEVDLRWGITEEDSRGNRQLALCLSEVARCELFVGILGERYGQTLSEYPLPDLPQFEWVKSYPKQRSITELEIMQFLRLHDVSPGEHAFFYTRDPAVLSSIPEEYRPDFESESEEARSRVSELKSRLKDAGLLVLENYSSSWGTPVSGRAFLRGLEGFGASVLDALWKAIVARYCQVDWGQAPDEDALQGAFQEAQSRQRHGRFRQLEQAASAVRGSGGRRPPGLLVIHGNPGQGKTAFLAGLVTVLSRGKAEPGCGETELLFHFPGATYTSTEAAAMLRRLCRLLASQLTVREGEESLPQTYRGLVLEFHSLLARFAECHPRGHLVLLIDGADCLQTHNKQLTSDWIPETVPHRVTLVLSVMEDSPLHRALAARRGVVPIHLGPLDPLDRSEIVRQRLAVFGKRLEESPFNNQMRQLVMKKESHNPLFLRLASDELREYGVFEKVSERIRALPPTLSSLIQHSLGCLEQEQGQQGVGLALSALHVSARGLRESDLYCLLCTSRGLPAGSTPPAWEEVMQEALKPSRPVPMTTFARLMRSLRRILVIWSPLVESSECPLRLSSSLLRTAVGQRYLGDSGHVRQLHLLLAVRLWTLVDPEGEGRFTNCDPDALPDLPQHLILCGQLPRLGSLLSNLQFCSLYLRLGLLPQLNVTHNLYHTEAGRGEGPPDDEVSHFRRFLASNAPVLGSEPTLFWQQALNQPEGSPVRAQALRCLLEPPEKLPEGLRLVEWTNRPQASACQGKVMLTPTVPLYVDISPSGHLALIGTSEGYLHILDLESGEEAGSLASTCDGISNCGFLDESTVCATSFDGKMEAWGLAEGYRLFQVEAHSDRITGCALSPDRKRLASSSWDRALKVWAVTSGKLDVSLENSQPLNCVTFHPEGRLIAVASWDRTVRIWDWVTASQVMVLEGAGSSVRALRYSPSGAFLASGSVLGEVLLWSCPSGSEAGRYRAHSGPITQLRFLASGTRLVTTGSDHQVRIWSGSLGQAQGEYRAGSTSPALCLSVSLNQERLAVGYHGDQLQVFQLATGALVTVCKGPPMPVRCLRWLRGEELLVAGTEDNLLRVWRLRGSQGSCKRLCRGHTRPPVCLSLSECFLASASEDFTVLLWPLAQLLDPECSAELLPACVLRGHADAVTCCTFSPDGRRLLTGSKDKTLRFWEVTAVPGRISRSLPSCHRDWITGCCWAPRHVASCSNDGTVRLWDPDTGECLQQLTDKSATFSSVSVTGDLVLSVTGNGELIVFKETGAVITTITGHSQRINDLVVFTEKGAPSAILGDGEEQHPLGNLTALTASDDGVVRRWYPLQVDEVATLSGHSAPVTGAAAVPGAPFLLTVGADRTLRLWEVPTQKDVVNPSAHGGAVTALGWSLSGEFLVSGSRNGEVKVWRSGAVLHNIQAHRKQISAVVFLSESTLALGSYDKVVSIWELTPEQHPPSVRVTLQSSFTLEFAVEWLKVLPGLGQLLVGDLRGNLTLWSPERGPWRAWDSCREYFSCSISRVIDRADGSLLTVESPPQSGLRIFHMGPPHSEETESETEGSEGTEQEEDLHPDWVKLTKSDAHFYLAPWGAREPEARDPSPWLTVVKESRPRGPGGARSMLCADSQGSLWCSQWDPTVTPLEEPHVQELSKWTRKQVHTDRVTAVTETEELIVTGSYDQTVRLWDCGSFEQVGLFSCRAPVLCLEANPAEPDLGACGDAGGNVYFLRWSSRPSPQPGRD